MTDINFSVLEAGKSKIKVQADLVSGEIPLPGGQMIIFSLCPHVADSRESPPPLYMGTNLTTRSPPTALI